MIPLIHEGFLVPPRVDSSWWRRSPSAFGIGPRGELLAVWKDPQDVERQLVTWHDGSSEPLRSLEIVGGSRASFVQPTADGGVLISSARWDQKTKAPTGQIWGPDGELRVSGDLGDALEQVLVTDSGDVWVGYFDEALTGKAPEGHGLVRFGSTLEPVWLYPWKSALPPVDDNHDAERSRRNRVRMSP